MKQRLCILLIGIFVLQLAGTLGCHSCSEQQFFSVIDVFLENSRIVDEAPVRTEQVAHNSYIKISDFCLKLTTGLEYYTRQDRPHPVFQPFSFSTAMASCNNTEPLPAQQITEIDIVSNADFIFTNEVFVLAGESLNKHLDISFGAVNKMSLLDFLGGPQSYPMELPMYIFINGIPAYNQIHRFSVYFALDDGQSYSTTTDKVIITAD